MKTDTIVRDAINLYKQNNNLIFVRREDLMDFLNHHLNQDFKSRARKPELTAKAYELLTVDTLPIYIEHLHNFGFTLRDIATLHDISEYMAKKLINSQQIRMIGEYTRTVYNSLYLYSIADTITVKVKPKKAITHVEIQMTTDNIADALYVINKSAKKSRDTKAAAYDQREYSICKTAKTRQGKLYYLKDKAITKLIDTGEAEYLGVHRQTFNNGVSYMDCYKIGNHTFHIPRKHYADDSLITSDITGLISAEKTKKVSVNYTQAVNLLERFTGIKMKEITLDYFRYRM